MLDNPFFLENTAPNVLLDVLARFFLCRVIVVDRNEVEARREIDDDPWS